MRLKKTKVKIKNISEENIRELITGFIDRCNRCECNKCLIVKNGIKLVGEECMARYLYENMIDVEHPTKVKIPF